VVVNYLPVGSEEATKWYVEQVLEAGCAFVNCIPVFIAREKYWQQRFEKRGLPVIGDDIKSQVGATITHRVLANLFVDRGVRIDRTYQLNFGGNTDFMNMLERERLESKKISKTSAVTSNIPYDLDPENVHVGPSDYVPWLKDRKWCHIRMEGTTFGDVPLNLEMKLEVWDSPNSAGVVIDAVRCAKLGLDHKLKGALIAPSSYFKKSPPVQIPDDISRELVEAYIKDPKGVEARMRVNAPTLKREVAPKAKRTNVRPSPIAKETRKSVIASIDADVPAEAPKAAARPAKKAVRKPAKKAARKVLRKK
jgi:myo-inositol-1-phosphate synthase